jgi:hypothetical protein
MERGFVRKSGAGDAGVIFLRLKSLGMDSLKVMIPRDLAVEIMGWDCYVERLWIVYRWFGTQSLKHLALRFCRWPEWNADS